LLRVAKAATTMARISSCMCGQVTGGVCPLCRLCAALEGAGD